MNMFLANHPLVIGTYIGVFYFCPIVHSAELSESLDIQELDQAAPGFRGSCQALGMWTRCSYS